MAQVFGILASLGRLVRRPESGFQGPWSEWARVWIGQYGLSDAGEAAERGG